MASKEKETKEQRDIHTVYDELSKLGKEFARFNERLRKLEAHSKAVNTDIAAVRVVSEKISARFAKIGEVAKARKPK